MRYAILIVLGLFSVGCAFPKRGATVDERRGEVMKMHDNALDELYARDPGAKEKLARAAGHGVFSNIGTNILIVSTEGGYGVVRDGREFVFWRADGSIVPRVNDVRVRGNVGELMKTQGRLGIDARTTVPSWDGGRPDYGYITEVLCYRRQYFDRQHAT